MTSLQVKREEWIATALADLEQAAAMLHLEAEEWRNRSRLLALSKKPEDATGRTCAQMFSIAATVDGMVRQIEKHCAAWRELITSDPSQGE